MLRLQCFSKEYTGLAVEIVGVIGGEKLPAAAFAAAVFHFRMPLQVIGQAFRYNRSLAHHLDIGRKELFDLVQQQGVMGTGQ